MALIIYYLIYAKIKLCHTCSAVGSDSMKQIIKEVFQAEERVGEILKQARNKASEIRRAVEKENAEKMADAKQKAREIIQTTVEEAKKEAERTRQEKLNQAHQERETLLKSKKETIDNLVDRICDIIVNTEYEKDKK
jgi:vacuolar-type H+-ATPase subunit H